MTQKENYNNKIRTKLLNLLQIPNNIFSDISPINFTNNREVLIQDCKGILEYNDKIIKINIGCNINVKFKGRNLTIKNITDKNIIIEGYIISLEFLT